MLSARCVGARWVKVDDEAVLDFDFEVRYCARVSVVRSATAPRVADALQRVLSLDLRELRVADAASFRQLRPLCKVVKLLSRGRKQEDLRRRASPAQIGRVLARRFVVRPSDSRTLVRNDGRRARPWS